MLASTKLTMPKYSFGTSDRKTQAKVYSNKHMAKTDFAGKYSPGPIYNVQGMDKFTYSIDGQTKIGNAARNTLDTGAKYDYYLRKDIDFEPQEADKLRRMHHSDVRIGLEARFQLEKRHKGTPGP